MEVPGQGLFGEGCLMAKRVYQEPGKGQQQAPVIDGKLDEDCWCAGWAKGIDAGPIVVENFHLLNNASKAVAKTKAYVCYDDEALYVAWECYERGLLTGGSASRADGRVQHTTSAIPDQKHGPYPWDRRVNVTLDTVGDKNSDRFYRFYANPAGLAYTTRSMGLKWNGVYELKTSIGKNVWCAEMKIPYSSLNLFPKTPEFWRIDFERIVPGYIVWGGTSECHLDPGLMPPFLLRGLEFSEYCYQVKVAEAERYLLGRNTAKAKVRNTGSKERKLVARVVLMSPGKGKSVSAAVPLELRGNEEKEIVFGYETKARGEHELIVQLSDAATNRLVCSSERHFFTVPEVLECALMEPHYRATIYASDPVEKIVVEGTVTPGPGSQLDNMEVQGELVAAENNRNLKQEVLSLRHDGKFTAFFSAEGLEDGRYYVAIKLKEGAKLMAEKKVQFRKVPPGANEIIADKNGNTLINGKPFFLLAPFVGDADKVAAFKDLGFNCSGWARNRKQLDELQAAGLKGFYHIFVHSQEKDYLAKYVNALKDHPALLGWYVFDEPSGVGFVPDKPRGNMKSLKEQYEEIARLDPYHPVIISDYIPDVYEVYEPVADVLCPDLYPIHAVRNVPLEWVANGLDRANRASAVGRKAGRGIKMIWYIPQAFGARPCEWGRWAVPTPEEMRCQVYLGVTQGVNGIVYYMHFPNADYCPPLEEIKKLNAELAGLVPVLFAAPKSNLKVTATPPSEIHTLLKECEGTYYLFAVNSGKSERNVTLTVAVPQGYANCEATLPYEQERRIEVKGGKINDSFPSHGARLYKIKPK
jgi:hypothetical protein